MKTHKRIIVVFCSALLLLAFTNTSYAQKNSNNSALIKRAETSGIELPVLAELQSRVETGDISNQQFMQIVGSAIEMSEQNLPADIVVQKALEGISKGISGDRIVPVINNIQGSIKKAAGVIDPWINRSEVQQMIGRATDGMSKEKFRNEMTKAASKSMMQNISTEAVSSILSQISDESLIANTAPIDIIVAMGVLPALPTISNKPGTSGTFIVRALKEGFKAKDLKKLPAALKTAQLRSQLPAASVIEGVARQMQGNIPAKQILQNLFNGNIGGGPPGNIPGLGNKPDRGNRPY